MFRLIFWFFTLLGFLTFVLLCGLFYLYAVDSYGIRTTANWVIQNASALNNFNKGNDSETIEPILTPDPTDSDNNSLEENEAEISTTTPVYSDAVTERLEGVSIPPGVNIPSVITDEQMTCFLKMLGKERVDEIKAGAKPTALEVIQGATCL